MIVLVWSEAASQFGVSSHTITVQVQDITGIQVNIGSINLTISGSDAIAGQDAMTTTDQSSTLLWGINGGTKKITAQTSLGSPFFTLKVVALSPSQGTAAPEVTLSSAPQDLLLNVGKSSGSCTLQYTGIALASQGTGSDAHTITFTVQAQ
ncbi:MAG: hypothetical protein HY562_12450 [Ignavibacteriales bacterium]|nr:hypothetical protein [Ignavibacteriales bacterium]